MLEMSAPRTAGALLSLPGPPPVSDDSVAEGPPALTVSGDNVKEGLVVKKTSDSVKFIIRS